jgi:hypothetical protein
MKQVQHFAAFRVLFKLATACTDDLHIQTEASRLYQPDSYLAFLSLG